MMVLNRNLQTSRGVFLGAMLLVSRRVNDDIMVLVVIQTIVTYPDAVFVRNVYLQIFQSHGAYGIPILKHIHPLVSFCNDFRSKEGQTWCLLRVNLQVILFLGEDYTNRNCFLPNMNYRPIRRKAVWLY